MTTKMFEFKAQDLIPAFEVTVDNLLPSDEVYKRINSITIVDNRGFEADTLDLKIDDTDNKIDLPRRGAVVTIKMGFKGQGLIDLGSFIVDSVEHAGAPDMLTIGAKSADFSTKFVEKKNKGHHEKTIGDIVFTVAYENKWKPVVSKKFKEVKIKDKQQSDESDANFLTRLAQELDAIVTVKSGRLLFVAAGEATTASGEPLPTIEIKRNKGDQHRYSINDRDAFTGVKANYNNAKHGKRKEVLAGDDAKVSTLRTTYRSEMEARIAAEAELKRLKRGVASFNFFLAVGNPALTAESPVSVSGFKKEIDETDWIATKVTHKLDGQGLTTQVECELKNSSK